MSLTEREKDIWRASEPGDIVPAGDRMVRLNHLDDVYGHAGGIVVSCEWTAMCDGDAVTLIPHPIIGYVPVCAGHESLAGKGATVKSWVTAHLANQL